MLIRLDPRSDQPIYVQIERAIADQIESGSLQSGDRLPSARSLGESLGVNMHTVLKAYSELDSRGMVEMRRGRGGVVVSDRADLSALTRSLVSEARRQGVGRRKVMELVEEMWV